MGKKTGMDEAHALVESVRNAPPNVCVIVRLPGGVFVFRWVNGRLRYRPIGERR